MYLMDFPGIENEPTFPQAEFEMMATQMSLNVLLKKKIKQFASVMLITGAFSEQPSEREHNPCELLLHIVCRSLPGE